MAGSPLIIGLGHRKRVGKDTLAEMLMTELEAEGWEVYHLAFAKALKSAAQGLFGLYGLRDAQHYEVNPNHREQPLEHINKTPRQLWIELGDAMRKIHPDLWLDHMRRQIEDITLHNTLNSYKPAAFIITDVRFPNEVSALKSWGATLVKVTRSSTPHTDDIADCALEGAACWDYIVRNDGSLNDLSDQAYFFTMYILNKERFLLP